MAKIYDINGNEIAVSGSGSAASKFDVTKYSAFTDADGVSARQAVLTYEGKRLYPVNYAEQRMDTVKQYGGGVMIALGDSYTAMGGSYFSAFANKHGLVCDNRGMGSSTIAGSEDGVTVGFHAFWTRLDAAVSEYTADGGYTIDGTAYTAEDVKLITMMGGANDWYTVDESQGIDRLGNPDSEDKEQLYGACKYIFSTMLKSFPNADIVIILQPTNINRIQPMWLKEGIIRDMAQMYSLPICDCCFEWYNPSNPVDAVTYWGDDKLHMTAAGNEAIMAKLEKTVNNLPFTRS